MPGIPWSGSSDGIEGPSPLLDEVVYTFVQFTVAKKGLLLSDEEFVTILNYIESTGLSSI